MAMSAEEEIPATAQHYLVCGTEDCKSNCQFYCNPCHQGLCERCRDEHQKNPDTENHEVVPYKQRKPQLPEEKCSLHPKRNVDILCKDCNAPLCAKCIFMKEHAGHQLDDLEEIYAEKIAFCRSEISKIQEYYLSTSHGLKKEIKEDVMEIKKTMDEIRNSIKAEAESLKELVDMVTSDKLDQANIMEESLLKTLNSQEKTYVDYTEYLEKLLKEFHSYKSINNFRVLFSDEFDRLKIQSIPETTQPVLPVFTAGQFYKDEVSKLLGSVNFPNTKLDNRRIKPMENASTQLKLTRKQTRRDREKADVKQTLSLSFSVTKVREYNVPGVANVYHISLGKSGRVWTSDKYGNLVQTNLQGNQLQKIQTNGRSEGYHTVTQDGDLIFTDKDSKVINRIKQDNTIIEFIKTGDWAPISIHSSHINGDILVGMVKEGEAKVTRYNKTGKEIQNIQWDNKGQGLYSYPHCITENINGDVCTSDINKRAVVVVNKSGQHRFSYTGRWSNFYPYGICNDLLGHIIVCDGYMNNALDIIDQDGQFLSSLLSQQRIRPCCVCVDDETNLHVGHCHPNTVTVYKSST